MARYVELNVPAILAQTPFDRDATVGIRCRIYDQTGAPVAGTPITLPHLANGHYQATWTPLVAGEYSLSYEFYTDNTFTTEDIRYEAGEDVLNVRPLMDSISKLAVEAGTSLNVPRIFYVDRNGPRDYFMAIKFPTDPDLNDVDYEIFDTAGLVVAPRATVPRVAVGDYQVIYTLPATERETPVVVFFYAAFVAIPYEFKQTAEIIEDEAKLDLLISRLTGPRADNLDFLDAAITSRQAEVDALARFTSIDAKEDTIIANQVAAQIEISAIRGTTDQLTFTAGNVNAIANVVVDKLDYDLSPTGVIEIINGIWDEPAVAHTVAGTFGDYLDAPVSLLQTEADALARYTNLQADTDNIDTNVITALTDIGLIKAKTDLLSFTGANVNANAIVVTDKSNYALSATTISTIIDSVWNEASASHLIAGSTGAVLAGSVLTPAQVATAIWDEPRASHVVVGTFGEANQGVLSTTRANNLDFLDVAVSSRAQTVTNFRVHAEVPEQIIIPLTGAGAKPYVITANVVDGATGLPADPDASVINISIVRADGTVYLASTAMARVSTGNYRYLLSVNETDIEAALNVYLNYAVATNAFQLAYNSETVEFENKIDILTSRLTATRASNLDFLDAAISSRANSSIVAQINDLYVNRLTAIRAGNLDFLDVSVSTRAVDATALTATDVENAVWDSLTAGHITVGSFGEIVQSLVASTPIQIASAVWDAPRAAHLIPDTYGKIDYAREVWDALMSLYIKSGSFGEHVQNIPTNPLLDNDPRIDNMGSANSTFDGAIGGVVAGSGATGSIEGGSTSGSVSTNTRMIGDKSTQNVPWRRR